MILKNSIVKNLRNFREKTERIEFFGRPQVSTASLRWKTQDGTYHSLGPLQSAKTPL